MQRVYTEGNMGKTHLEACDFFVRLPSPSVTVCSSLHIDAPPFGPHNLGNLVANSVLHAFLLFTQRYIRSHSVIHTCV